MPNYDLCNEIHKVIERECKRPRYPTPPPPARRCCPCLCPGPPGPPDWTTTLLEQETQDSEVYSNPPFELEGPTPEEAKLTSEYEEETDTWSSGGGIVPPNPVTPAPVSGCTNPAATNYNPLATVDDGSCILPVPGCTNPAATNYNPLATVDDGSCILPVPGCTNPAATNYNPLATVDDGSCILPVPGCTNPAATNYNPLATVDDGSCILPVSGCTNPAATNYNPLATVDDGSCILPVPGCTNPAATNYNPLATVDDGSCIIPACIPYEPPDYEFDTRVEPNLEIPFDYLWGLEISFRYNPYNRLYFQNYTNWSVPAFTKPANVVFYAYRPSGFGRSRWDSITLTVESPAPPNPDPSHYTNAHWQYIYQTKWAYENHPTVYYGIERYATQPYPTDTTQSYIASLEKVPMTGFDNVNKADSISSITTKYESTIHYKTQFTLDEAKETSYMWYLKEYKYLPPSIQTASTGADIHTFFSHWSATDVSDFKAWAQTKETTVNKYFAGPAVQGTCEPAPGQPGGIPPNPSGRQYTSNHTKTGAPTEQEMIDAITIESQAAPNITSQDPDGDSHILPEFWSQAVWDGTPIDPTSKTQEELCEWLFPSESGLVVRGIRELFYEVRPFVDVTSPTPREIDLWNIEVVRHFRRMFGISLPVNLDARLELEARWASERKYTQDWDATYPLDCDGNTTKGGPCGPCWNGGTATDTTGGHCGAAFWPNATDRAPYIAAEPYLSNPTEYPELDNYTARRANAEGINAIGVEVPWSLKLAVIIASWICDEYLSGHPGPYVNPGTTRETMGFDWWYLGTGGVAFRGKYR